MHVWKMSVSYHQCQQESAYSGKLYLTERERSSTREELSKGPGRQFAAARSSSSDALTAHDSA